MIATEIIYDGEKYGDRFRNKLNLQVVEGGRLEVPAGTRWEEWISFV